MERPVGVPEEWQFVVPWQLPPSPSSPPTERVVRLDTLRDLPEAVWIRPAEELAARAALQEV